uniref:Transposable element Tc1 transposase n=1 Tax=Zeugodacus cucurbitae TaxID=28588 RepID=A0A0A1XH96_ZEUCU
MELETKDFNFWNTVIFADESKFNLFGSDGMAYVWRKPNTELQRCNIRPTVKHGGGSVMVWVCMSAAGVGNLVFIESILDKTLNLNILKENLIQSAEKLGIRQNFRYYQDNDPKHKASIVQSWLIWNCTHLMNPPAQSPDMNPIENLWSLLENNIRKHRISNKKQLKSAILEEWNKIGTEITKKLVESMPARLKAVLKGNGYHTKY